MDILPRESILKVSLSICLTSLCELILQERIYSHGQQVLSFKTAFVREESSCPGSRTREGIHLQGEQMLLVKLSSL